MVTAEQQAEFRTRLEEERDQLTAIIRQLDAEVQELGDYEETERATLSDHPADSGTELYEQEQAITLERNERALLERVEHALERLDAGEYGQCERCGREIPFERLEALPYATFCITCQVAVERERSAGAL
jgi:RNA polymerase-binding protein DksA